MTHVTGNVQIAEVYFNRGSAKIDLLDYAGAIAEYSKALEMNPKFAEAYHNRGLAKKISLITMARLLTIQRQLILIQTLLRLTSTEEPQRLPFKTILAP